MEKVGFSTETVAGQCDTHGSFEAEVILVGGRRVGGDCPECRAEADRKRDAEEAQERVRNRVEHLTRVSGVPTRFLDATIANYRPPTEHAAAVRESCREYVERFSEVRENGSSLILCGGVGTGKTHLAAAIAKGVIKRHLLPAIYTSVSAVMRRIRSTYGPGSDETEGEVIDRVTQAPLLVLDEVGVQLGGNHEHTMLFDILNGRYSDMQPTVVVSNLGVTDLEGAIGERVVDRLRENGAVLTFDWGSYRRGAA